MRHNWKTEDDDVLRAAIDVVSASPLKRSPRFWSAVAGRLLPGLAVTSDACRSRWQRLSAVASDTGTTGDGWKETIEAVDKAEADNWDFAIDCLSGIRDELGVLSARLTAIEVEQRRLAKAWE